MKNLNEKNDIEQKKNSQNMNQEILNKRINCEPEDVDIIKKIQQIKKKQTKELMTEVEQIFQFTYILLIQIYNFPAQLF
jgi:hypothetical protein